MSTPAANLKINSSRLWDSLMEMAKIVDIIEFLNFRVSNCDS